MAATRTRTNRNSKICSRGNDRDNMDGHAPKAYRMYMGRLLNML
jgi:hypothetical protein